MILFFSIPALAESHLKITNIATIAPDIIEIVIQEGFIKHGKQIEYQASSRDLVDRTDVHRWVKRDGKLIGAAVGKEGKIFIPFDTLVGEKLDVRQAAARRNYWISSKEDADYRARIIPEKIYRKSKPTDLGRVQPGDFKASMEHRIFLKLPEPLEEEKSYRIEFNKLPFENETFFFSPRKTRSSAVHVSQIGFSPEDPVKAAFLSSWLGNGGGHAYREGLTFELLDDNTGKSVFQGKVALSKDREDRTEDAYKRNYNKTDVYIMDFSSCQKPGTYRICVEGVGCSYPFPIGKDVWEEAFTLSARGFYHKRSGVAIGPPYTEFRRERGFHPDDGVKVFQSTTPLMDTGNGLNKKDSNFGNLVKGRTDIIVPDAWGGYMDAGDWDRRIQHLDASRLLIDLAMLFPQYFEELSLNIPESGGTLPDIVDEALFNIDFYRRLQTREGGIRGGIESEEHPRYGETSWQESLTIIAYAPGIWSSYYYAGVAARTALLLASRDKALSKTYRESALSAMTWAEREFEKDSNKSYSHEVNDSRNLAAAELYRLTGEGKWHDLFLRTTALKDGRAELFQWQSHDQREAAWVYARTKRKRDEDIQGNCTRALIREADNRIASIIRTGFRWAKYEWMPVVGGVLSSPDGISLVRAHVLTGESKYHDALIYACQTGLGANPGNICYTTGLGHQSPRHALDIDARLTGQPVPPGLTVYGPLDTEGYNNHWDQRLIKDFLFPSRDKWPTLEAFFDVFWNPLVCEYTIHNPMARNAYVWGYMAAVSRQGS